MRPKQLRWRAQAEPGARTVLRSMAMAFQRLMRCCAVLAGVEMAKGWHRSSGKRRFVCQIEGQPREHVCAPEEDGLQ